VEEVKVVEESDNNRASWEEVGSGSSMASLEEEVKVVVESGSSMASSSVGVVVNGSSMA